MTAHSDNKDESATPHQRVEVRVNGQVVHLTDPSPTGSQLLAAARLRPASEFALLEWPVNGPTREVGLEEVICLPEAGHVADFIAVQADGVLYFVLDGDRYAWAGPLDADTVRRIGRLPQEKALWLERRDQPDVLLEPGQTIHLERAGVEQIYTRAKVWFLDVQGDRTEWDRPLVGVREALEKAGVDLTKQWTIVLKVKGKEPRQVELNDTVDLREPGIERLWLRPRQVNNGDGPSTARREFSLLSKDEAFLSNLGYDWETIKEGAHRWLIVTNYPVPPGYDQASCRLAVDVPPSYPTAQIDMFYCDPPLTISNGTVPAATDSRVAIGGVPFQRWSRHRPDGQWAVGKDSVATHFGLIDAAISREVGA